MRKNVSANKLAEILDVAPNTVRGWIKKGLIPSARKRGKKWQIPLEEVELALNSKHYPPDDRLRDMQTA